MHDNRAVSERLGGYLVAGELCEDVPGADDILTGTLEAKAPGDTAMRTLSRQTLFHVLQQCPTITVRTVAEVTNGRFAERTCRAYAAAARVASKALARQFEQARAKRQPIG
jgi:hypothetical protein